jgi:hypothetical protein
MTKGDREFERNFPGKKALDVFPMDGTEKACPRCDLQFSTMLHGMCEHRYCPPNERAGRR